MEHTINIKMLEPPVYRFWLHLIDSRFYAVLTPHSYSGAAIDLRSVQSAPHAEP